jgi:guanylate kinase
MRSVTEAEALRARGFPVVLAGPSGSGKTTVARRLARDAERYRFSVSATTRPPRPGEVEGEDYRFMDRSAFLALRDAGELLEWAEVHGELYGTPRGQLQEARGDGVHLLLDIDVQGARSVRRLEPDVVTIFLVPPTGERIIERLRNRGSEGETARRRRMRTAEEELRAVPEFDFVVLNDDLEVAVRDTDDVVRAEELRIRRMGTRVSRLVGRLEAEIRSALAAEDVTGTS